MNEEERVSQNRNICGIWAIIKAILELREMCMACEAWHGAEHDYNDCRNKPCFKFWFADQYLLWETSRE